MEIAFLAGLSGIVPKRQRSASTTSSIEDHKWRPCRTQARARPQNKNYILARFRPDECPDPEIPLVADENERQKFTVDPDRVQYVSEENLRGFVKTRGSLIPGEEFVFWWTGDIYGLVEDQPNKHLFAFEGYNIGRMVRVDGGWRLLTREVGIYRDPVTREILKQSWFNPYTLQDNEVVHTWNDPVNQQFLLRNRTANADNASFIVPTTLSGDDLYWHAEISLCYPSPLPASQFPARARTDMYHSLEMFQFFCKTVDLESDSPSAPCQISWVRVSQWLPWMEMGDKPGRMVYHCRGKKLARGYAELPESLRLFVESHHKVYTAAPYDYTTPNETSWTYFKKLLMQKRMPRADGTIAKPEEIYERTASNDPVTTSDNGKHSMQLNGKRGSIVAAVEDVDREFSLEDLAQHDGTDLAKPIYVSLGGLVFDVSTAKRHYSRGEAYNCLVGRDATYAFACGNLTNEGTRSRAAEINHSFTAEQRTNLENWIKFFAKTYPQVGWLEQR